MRVLSSEEVANKVYELCLDINFVLRRDIFLALKSYLPSTEGVSHVFLRSLIENALIAKKKKIPLCQDTGLVVIFLELGKDTVIRGNLKKDFALAVEKAYKDGYLRASIVRDPLNRDKSYFSPPVIHVEYNTAAASYLTVLAKGFGSENKTKLFMLLPTINTEQVVKVVLDAIKDAGADACPPFLIGIGIGGTSDKAVYLAKKALTLPISGKYKGDYPELAKKILTLSNKLNIGVLGMGNGPTVLGVNILAYPTHIAGLPLAINIGCHSTRSKRVKL